jgi:hypothetical protein
VFYFIFGGYCDTKARINCPVMPQVRWESTVGLVVRQSPAGNDMSRRGPCWDLLPSNG